ncbi:unnamed protein product [Didymodactylos carnosus]|uniref:Ammonium transporter AmtB-like domain-containing protein n=1 Tax=Didymodactylos carnosus TaxID=1234261 RepID=A0A8S2DG74_9BILA|nr:unnamed protein product [Didymodactylos carnosus]CAF3725706.1 unnamed protein product [Didymodactylos carnosus]
MGTSVGGDWRNGRCILHCDRSETHSSHFIDTVNFNKPTNVYILYKQSIGLFCQQAVNPAGFDGAFYGHPIQMWRQLAGILTTIGFVSVVTAGILLILHFTIGIRLDPKDQALGLDRVAHGESWEIQDRFKDVGTNTRSSIRPNQRPIYPAWNKTKLHVSYRPKISRTKAV